VTISQAGSYVLTSNLTVQDASTSAIYAEVSGVALDLGGFLVSGPTVCTGEPVTSCAPTGSATGISIGADSHLHGGTVRGFGNTGVGAGTDSRVWDVTVTSNGQLGVPLSRGASLRNSTVTFNGSNGIGANFGGGFGEVAGCTVRGNLGNGVQATAGLIVDSRFQNDGGTGITGSAAAGRNVANGNATTPEISTGIDVIACNQVASQVVCPP
jgi:hypothetical protein